MLLLNSKCIDVRAAVAAMVLVVVNAAAGATPVNPSDNVEIQWNAVALEAIRVTRPAPPVAARALAIVNTCTFDAWAVYDQRARGTRFGHALKAAPARRTLANKAEAVSYAAYRALLDLFPQATVRPLFDSVLTQQGYSLSQVSNMDRSTNAGIGNSVCKAVLDYRHNDGSNQLGKLNNGAPYSDYTGYQPVNTPDQIIDANRWQPLRVPDGKGGFTEQKFAVPQWGRVIPFALRNPDRSVIEAVRGDVKRRTGHVGPAKVTDENFLEQAEEMLAYNASLVDVRKVVAEYWADGPSSETPPGHWDLFAQYVSARDRHTLDQDVKMLFAVSNTLFDTSIAIWGAKVKFDSVRPITAVHFLFAGRTVNSANGPVLGEYWQPYQAPTFITPPFAEYPSGHSAFSSSAAEILKRFTGSDVFGAVVKIPMGSSRVQPGIAPAHDLELSWATFTDAADEAGISRRHGGIHFSGCDLESRLMGRRVAELVWPVVRYYYGETSSQFSHRDDE